MLRFIISRFGQTLAVLFTASVIIFALMRLIPGDPVLMMLGDDFTEDAYERMKGQLGLDRPIPEQAADDAARRGGDGMSSWRRLDEVLVHPAGELATRGDHEQLKPAAHA